MYKIVRLMMLAIASFFASSLFAQTNTPPPNDFMHSNGKLYVVVLVVFVIISGLFIYLINLDRKISALEKE